MWKLNADVEKNPRPRQKISNKFSLPRWPSEFTVRALIDVAHLARNLAGERGINPFKYISYELQHVDMYHMLIQPSDKSRDSK